MDKMEKNDKMEKSSDSGFLSMSHTKSSSLSSSGYYSRLDSSDFPEEEAPHWHTHFSSPCPKTHNNGLHNAVLSKDVNSLVKILKQIPHVSLLNLQNAEGKTALHLSVITNQPEITRMLVANGADLGVRDLFGNNSAHLAAAFGFEECLKSVVMARERGDVVVGFEVFEGGLDLEVLDFGGRSPLHLSLQNNHTPCAQLLLFHGASTTTKELKAGRTVLHLAVASRNLDALKLLLEFVPKSFLDAEDYSGRSAYEVASCDGLREFCSVLETAGAGIREYFSSDSDEE